MFVINIEDTGDVVYFTQFTLLMLQTTSLPNCELPSAAYCKTTALHFSVVVVGYTQWCVDIHRFGIQQV